MPKNVFSRKIFFIPIFSCRVTVPFLASEAAGCNTDVVKCLRAQSVEQLVALTQQFPTWRLVVDAALGDGRAVMPLDQLTALLSGQYKAEDPAPPPAQKIA